MNIIILFDGDQYLNVLLPPDVNPDMILEKHPGFMFLDHATSQAEAESKIQRDRDRHESFWM